jgi:hypothetical protein
MTQSVPIPSALAELAGVTDFLLTEELARYLRCADQTIRKAYSATGNYRGIRPVKPGGRLLWPITEVARMLAGGAR